MKIINEVLYMSEALSFIDSLEDKARKKVLSNISKAQEIRDPELFSKLDGEIWEFRTIYNKICYRLFAFWDKKQNAVVICTHGLIKKTQKTPSQEIEKAERLRKKYFETQYHT